MDALHNAGPGVTDLLDQFYKRKDMLVGRKLLILKLAKNVVDEFRAKCQEMVLKTTAQLAQALVPCPSEQGRKMKQLQERQAGKTKRSTL